MVRRMTRRVAPAACMALGACSIALVGCSDDGGRGEDGASAPMTGVGPGLDTGASESDPTSAVPTSTGTPTTGDEPETTSIGESTGPTAGDCNTLVVDPPTATITIDNGAHAPVQLTATCDGKPVAASWSGDASFVAMVDENGLVTAGGQYGGSIGVQATYGVKSAGAVVDVFLKVDKLPPEVNDPEKNALDNPTMPDPAAALAYPYDKTVFPKGLQPPELMWNGSTAGDKYLIRYSGKYVDVKIYTLAEPPSSFLLDKGLWVQITESSSGLPLDLSVHRLPAGSPTATTVAQHQWTIASQPLIGSVYYWANSLGRVLRINPGADAPEDFLLAGGQNGCSTCHSVSANGATLIIGGDIQASNWDLTTNTLKFNTEAVGKPVRHWAMAAISPDGSVVVENGETNLPGPPGGNPGMWDAATGQKLVGTGVDDLIMNMPAFSPDGRKLTYVDHSTLSLWVLDYDEATKTAANPVKLVDPGADPTLSGIIFPSMSPDGKWIVYHRGTYPASLDTRFGPGELYLASVDQPGVEIRLGNATGDAYPFVAGDRDRHYNYEPTFAPETTGGYHWVVFTSRRTYGNRLTGNKDQVKQLWLFAIDADPQPGQDPSHPPFWMPGQDPATLNMRGFWAHKYDDPGG